jgi:hypothetical protein
MIFYVLILSPFTQADVGNMEPNVLLSCILSFLAVFILLGILALLIRIVSELFPAKTQVDDAAIVAAIQTASAFKYPGARVTRIEEIRK